MTDRALALGPLGRNSRGQRAVRGQDVHCHISRRVPKKNALFRLIVDVARIVKASTGRQLNDRRMGPWRGQYLLQHSRYNNEM
jgi:hypothetical protein